MKNMLEWVLPLDPSVGPQVPVVFTDFVFQVFVSLCGAGAVLTTCGISGPQPGIKPTPPAWAVWSFDHWTTREVPVCSFTGFNLFI